MGSWKDKVLSEVNREWKHTTGGTSEDIDIHGNVKEDLGDKGFYQKHHGGASLKYDKYYRKNRYLIKNVFSVELNVPGFTRNLRTAFFEELKALQNEYISFVSGIYRDAQFIAFPGTPKIIMDTARSLIGSFKARVADKNKFYLAYVEWGTGLNVEWPGYDTSMMERALGSPERKFERLGGFITARGKGCAWTDPGGTEHPGADFLFIPLKKGAVPIRNKEDREGEDRSSFKIRRKSSGQKAKRRLSFASKSFLTPMRLLKFTQDVFHRALNMEGSYKNLWDRTKSLTQKQYKRIEAISKKW